MNVKFTPILEIPSRTSLDGVNRFRVLSDGEFLYLVMPDGVFKTPNSNGVPKPPVRLSLPSGELNNFYIIDQTWFLLKHPGTDGHVFLKSGDAGRSWASLDNGLQVPAGNTFTRLTATRMGLVDGGLFLNAGGGTNFLASYDDGNQWKVLAGVFGTAAAYPGQFLVREYDVWLGGEAPLDFAYLRKGRLAASRLEWEMQPRSVAPQELGNRNVQFIEEQRGTRQLFAGVEGGIMRSLDRGNSWNWSLKFAQADGKYPYIQQICFSRRTEEQLWIGGFDKAKNGEPYLAFSDDNGDSFTDLSQVFQTDATWRNVLAIHELDSGEIWAATFAAKEKKIKIGRLQIG
jgi:hypothetical protein